MKLKILIIIIVMCFSLNTFPSYAKNIVSDRVADLEKSCKYTPEEQPLLAGSCLGYFRAILYTLRYSEVLNKEEKRKQTFNICLANNVTTGQIIRVFLKYVKERPETLHEHQFFVTIRSLEEAFPCVKSKE